MSVLLTAAPAAPGRPLSPGKPRGPCDTRHSPLELGTGQYTHVF